MNQLSWRNLNYMPANFRKKTTDSFILHYKKILADTDKERLTTHRSMEEALKEARKVPEFSFLEDDINAGLTYSTLEGRTFMNFKTARIAFINICRQIDGSLAAEIITVWFENSWQQLKEVVRKTKSIHAAGKE